jgi:hypothetical protein
VLFRSEEGLSLKPYEAWTTMGADMPMGVVPAWRCAVRQDSSFSTQ